ncbi:tryptophan synthase subunit alpha [Halocella sp. SP3-1]|uniref:tryptophan synthase subunit alpha n=1 Tax=Halocella sp. SP3-1 TaxID=2382161 RepID=UPI000F74EB47|nr:tryptophan synthase subunit alpha [Halocella sp. SP3-1]AZO94345.1 hypothetical protein D7D81_06885 [Halocella sp. SP3-1]
MLQTNILKNSLIKKKEDNKPVMIAYLPAAYPDIETSKKWIEILFDNGIDAVELGYPSKSTDMDGKTISDAHQEVKNDGFKESDYEMIARYVSRNSSGRLIAMGYWKELREKFYSKFENSWLRSGIKYLLLPDLNLSNKTEVKYIQDCGYKLIPFISRLDFNLNYSLFKNAPFIYCPAYKGKTGNSGKIDKLHLTKLKEKLRETVLKDLPLLVGFGISTGEDAFRVRSLGYDGIIIGTAMLKAFQESENRALTLIRELRAGLEG